MKREDVFERLDPPLGGLTKLRTRLEGRPSTCPWVLHACLAGAVLAAVALVLVLVMRRPKVDLVATARASSGAGEIAVEVRRGLVGGRL
jgi:hypothetical protein